MTCARLHWIGERQQAKLMTSCGLPRRRGVPRSQAFQGGLLAPPCQLAQGHVYGSGIKYRSGRALVSQCMGCALLQGFMRSQRSQ